ncbi:hypothetical protein [Oceanobacillus salinisoli]|uniref:hypothetical protein n=1 Tax=Oceanobacillus salinisoli TaxID=2678611 RepID=UPI0012E25A99|nr:hypothetical protein [Oceanobacillus salinisoli]
MTKTLSFITEQKGFMLPYVLFITTMMLILILSSIQLYRNDIYLTEQYVEHVRVETIFQMGQMKFKQEILQRNLPPPAQIQYEFPDGKVNIVVSQITEHYCSLLITVTTNKRNFKYTFPHTLPIPE